MESRTISLCGVPLNVACQTAHQLSLVINQWRRLFVLGDESEAPATVVYSFKDFVHPGSPAPRGVEVFRSGQLSVLKTAYGAHLRCGSSALDVDVANGRCLGVLSDDFWDVPLEHQREFFLLSFLMVLRPLGLYGLHANGLLKDGTGYLVAGVSGSGKTTLSLTLIREGWGFLSDDAHMLHETPQGIEALPIRRGFSCTAQTASRFPELRALAGEAAPLLDGKRLVDISQAYPDSFYQSCYPSVLLFPVITNEPRSCLKRIEPLQGMVRLLELSAGIMVEKKWVTEQMKVLKLLVDQSHCYQLQLGTDVYEAPEAVAGLLASISDRNKVEE